MNGGGASEDNLQSLLSTASSVTTISGAGSTTPLSSQLADSISPNSIRNLSNITPNGSTAEANTPSELSVTIGDSVGRKEDGQEGAQDKGREAESASEGGELQPSMNSVKPEETVLDPVNVQIELLEHAPDVVDDGQDWAPDVEHEMKRVKASTFASTYLYLMFRKWMDVISLSSNLLVMHNLTYPCIGI